MAGTLNTCTLLLLYVAAELRLGFQMVPLPENAIPREGEYLPVGHCLTL